MQVFSFAEVRTKCVNTSLDGFLSIQHIWAFGLSVGLWVAVLNRLDMWF